MKLTISKPAIDFVSCDKEPKCSFWDAQRLGFFSQKGTVIMKDTIGVIDKDDYNLKLIVDGNQKVTLKGCTVDEQVKIRLVDESNNLIEQKDINI